MDVTPCPGVVVTVAVDASGTASALSGHVAVNGRRLLEPEPVSGPDHACCGPVTPAIIVALAQKIAATLRLACPAPKDILTVIPQDGLAAPAIRTWRDEDGNGLTAARLSTRRVVRAPLGDVWEFHGSRVRALQAQLAAARRPVLQGRLGRELEWLAARRAGFDPRRVLEHLGGECAATLPLALGYDLVDKLPDCPPAHARALLRRGAWLRGLGEAHGAHVDAAALLLAPLAAVETTRDGAVRLRSARPDRPQRPLEVEGSRATFVPA